MFVSIALLFFNVYIKKQYIIILLSEQAERIPHHFVSKSARGDRDSRRDWNIKPGFGCIVYQDDPSHPWYAGIILEVVFKDPSAADKDKEASIVTVHKCGNITHSLDPKASHGRWYVNNQEPNANKRNMFLSTRKRTRPEKGYKPQETTEDAASLADWGKVEDIFTRDSCIKHTILTALDKNPNVPWKFPK